MKILAVDLGLKRTGFAVSDPDERLAVALPTLERADAARVARVVAEQGAEMVVVGLPLNMDGSRGERALAAEDFSRKLQPLVSVPVTLWDERLSSAEGESRLRNAGLTRKERARRSDAAAAIVILESFLASRRSRG